MFTATSARGKRSYQEDRYFIAEVPDGTLVGVFDGHGGDEASSVLADSFANFWSAIDGDCYTHALLETFKMADSLTKQYHSGSTASVVFIPKNEKMAYIAALGDSPVLAEKSDGTVFIGPDHNARSNPEERSQAIARGGIYQNGYMWSDYGDNSSGLQMTRAFGDVACRNFLNRIPEVFEIPLGNWLLVGSDGLFDPKHMDGRSSYDDVLACIRNDNTAEHMVQQAVALPTNDNVTAILWRRDRKVTHAD